MKNLEKPSKDQEQAIMLRLEQQDSRWFELLYLKYWDKLIQQACYFIRNRDIAEEIVQELFIRLFVKGIRFRITSSLGAYLHKALRNSILNHLRDEALYRTRIAEAGRKTGTGINAAIGSLDLSDTEKRLQYYLSLLPLNCRTVFLLNRERGLTIKQIAKHLMKPENTVEKQLGRAVSFLREHLAKNLN